MLFQVALRKRLLSTIVLTSAFLLSSFAAHAGTTSLLKTATTINLPAGYSLNQFTQMNFSGSSPTYGLTSDHNFFPSMISAPTPNISSYATSSSGNIILTDTTPVTPIISVYNPTGNTPLKTITNKYISTSAIGQSSIYGCSYEGNIYSINPAVVTPGSYALLSTIKYPIIKDSVTDTSQTSEIVYTLSLDSSYQSEYLCSTTAAGASACDDTPVLQTSDLHQKIMASNGVVYVTSTPLNGDMTINAFTKSDDGKSLIQYPGFNTLSIPGFAASPLVYGSDTAGNKFIYVVVQQGKTFQLQALNATTGAPLWSYQFGANETVSNPFVTTSGNVLLVKSNSKNIIYNGLYGFTNTGTPAFASGYTLPLPQNSTPALQLIIADSTLSNTIDIPATLTDGVTPVYYSVNIDW